MDINLTLTEKQARVIQDALDLYARVLTGQVENVEEVLRRKYFDVLDVGSLQVARVHLNCLKMEIWAFSPNESHGLNNPKVHDDARKAFDLQQVIRNGIATVTHPEGGHTVDFDQPRQTSTTEDLATIKVRP